ncbi:hypothetical protein GCM10017687_65790 [Streptomyces echinatus]
MINLSAGPAPVGTRPRSLALARKLMETVRSQPRGQPLRQTAKGWLRGGNDGTSFREGGTVIDIKTADQVQ